MNYDFYDINLPNDLMPYDNINNYSQNDLVYNNMNNYSQNNLELFNPYEGYLKGNAFKDEYKPFKNYKVAKINITNEKEEMLLNIGQYSFMMHDINLYLDVHPNDSRALNMFIDYRNKVNELITKYERKYGPLSVKGAIDNNTPFSWEDTKWPWVN